MAILGTGRPFAFECVSAKKAKFTAEDLIALENYINSSSSDVRVNSLALVTKKDIKR
jgi:tRNA U54 and U55 pseudouridine synthase Pus10